MASKSFDDKRRETAAKLAALMLANAFIFQEQLSSLNNKVKPIRKMVAQSAFLDLTAQHWKMITEEIDYVPIFTVARDILMAMPADMDTDQAVRRLATRALDIVQKKAALRHDLMGRIYHLLLLEAKYLGTYYTSVPAATLLLKLTMDIDRWPKIDWSDKATLRKFRIADLACGTGTLLMAANQTLIDNYIKFTTSRGEKVTDDAIKDIHRLSIEEMLHGYDVLPSAVHLTASTLALLAPDTSFNKMRLYCLSMGRGDSGKLYLGSIDYMTADVISAQLDLMTSADGATQAGDLAPGSMAPLPQLDICVMNPPFVRSVGGNLLFGSIPGDRKDMQEELAKRLKKNNVSASSTAGLGSVFTAIGDRHLAADGRLALVLPAAITSGIAWDKTRQLLSDKYVVETVVASHDPQRWNFSENTDLSEVLIVARKRKPVGDDDLGYPTQFISLWHNPDSSALALALGERISRDVPARLGNASNIQHGVRELTVGATKFGESVTIPWGEVKSAPWLGAAFAQTNLVRTAWLLRDGVLYRPGQRSMARLPITTLGQLAILGPDRRDVADGFSVSPSRTSYPAFWGHRAEQVTSIGSAATKWLVARTEPAKGRPARDAALLWERSGRLMLAERSWLNTQRTLAVKLKRYALSNVWWPVRMRDGDEVSEKILALWLNSSLGIVSLLGHRIPTRGAWVQFKKPTLAGLPVLDFRALKPSQRKSLEEIYDSASTQELRPISEIADDDVRASIDKAICHVLGLPSLDSLRSEIAQEPIVSLRACDEDDQRKIEAPAQFELL